MTFQGFSIPEQNYSKLPHQLIDLLPEIDSLAELKVTLYTLRHTWGFSEYDKPKKITTDEFENGRKRRDGTRIDNGTGLSPNSIRAGLEKAIERGTLTVEVDDTDKARIEKYYSLNMSDDSNLAPRPAKVAPRPAKVEERTEKETIERKDIGTNVPNTPLDWKIAANQPITETDLQKGTYDPQKARDVANKIGERKAGAEMLALAFQDARRINLSDDPQKIKGQRKAAADMLASHVTPEHIRQAVKSLVDKGMTVTDLFSVSKTAIDLANPVDAKQPVEVTYDQDGAPESW